LPVTGEVQWGEFLFHEVQADGSDSPWMAALPAESLAQVRAWRDGDRLSAAGGHPRRRVKRYLSEAGVRGIDRAGWPVVVAGDAGEVLWIPGVRRSDAATVRSGRPVRHYVCERIVTHR
jgi:tRNA(Ile)-lysidine synthetase-like protein